MKERLSVEEQVRNMTLDEKDKTLKIGKSEKLVGSLMLTAGCLCLVPIIAHAFKVGPKKVRGLFPAATITCSAMGLLTLCYSIYKKTRLPFYSYKKYKYLKKHNIDI